MTNFEPCDLHELTNCAICSGAAAKHEESLRELVQDRGAAPYIPGGTTIFASFPGSCMDCGRRFEKGDLIHSRRGQDGWIGVECCT